VPHYKQAGWGKLPVKLKRTKVTNRYFNYLIIKEGNGNTIVEKRTDKGIWHNLYQFPLIETESMLTQDEVVVLIKANKNLGFVPENIRLLNEGYIVHKLSHQHLHINFWEITTMEKLKNAIPHQQAKALPFPIVVYKFIEGHWL
jgi:A/G-specific adenine glycosylase